MSDSSPAPTPAAPAPPQPQVFGKYYLLDRLAVGGMAEIFRARTFGEGGFENQLVIKRILTHLSEDENFVRMFMDEAKVTVLLQHANIVRIYDFGKIRANYFIAMEYVEGKDVKLLLRKLSEKRKLLPVEFACFIAMEAAKGLDYAHKRSSLEGAALNVVHRDVSPSNVLLGYDGVVKVADFGIVKASNVRETTDAGTLKGKFEYMSPEQAQGQALDRRSDVFSLGICLHEMLTGRRLFKGENDLATLERIKTGDVPAPRQFNPGIPEALEAIVLRALSVDPAARQADARELANDLLGQIAPTAPDVIQQRLAIFLADVFSEEIATEHQRLEEATRRAREMHHSADAVDLDESWDDDEAPSTTRTGSGVRTRTGSGLRAQTNAGFEATPAPPPRTLPLVALGVLAVVAAAAAVWFATRVPTEKIVEKERVVQAPGASTGGLRLTIAPAASHVRVDGVEKGSGASVNVTDLAPGAHLLRVEAEGMRPYEETVTVVAGENERISVLLKPDAVAPRPVPQRDGPRQQSTVTAAQPAVTATVAFSSRPAGADVLLNGRVIGTTPFTWDGKPGDSGSVQFRLEGHQTATASFSLPEGGGRVTVERSLATVAAASGTLSVAVQPRSCEVWVDGKKIKDGSVFNLALSEGVHEVRVRHAELGIDEAQKVTIVAGQNKRVSMGTGQ